MKDTNGNGRWKLIIPIVLFCASYLFISIWFAAGVNLKANHNETQIEKVEMKSEKRFTEIRADMKEEFREVNRKLDRLIFDQRKGE